MGTKWMIESTGKGYPEWWTGETWSTDCHKGLQFDTQNEAGRYMVGKQWDRINVDATEHMFMSPLSTTENMN